MNQLLHCWCGKMHKEEGFGGYGSRQLDVHNGGGGIKAEAAESSHLNHRRETESAGNGVGLQTLQAHPWSASSSKGWTPRYFHHLPQQPPAGNQVFKYMSLWRMFVMQTIPTPWESTWITCTTNTLIPQKPGAVGHVCPPYTWEVVVGREVQSHSRFIRTSKSAWAAINPD